VRRRAHSAFTLIELIAVLVIVGLLLAITPLALDWLVAEKELESEVSRLGNWVSVLKDQAILDQAPYALHYDTERNRYAIQTPKEVVHESANPDEEPVTVLELARDVDEADLDWYQLPKGIKLEFYEGTRRIEKGRYQVLFDPLGTVPPHTLILTSNNVSSLEASETTRTLKVNFSGLVSYALGRVVEDFKKTGAELGR